MSIFPRSSDTSGSPTITSINNYFSSGVVAPIYIIGGNYKSILSGALTAGVLKTVLSVAGSGVIKWCAVQNQDTTSRTLRLKVTLDDVIVFDSTTSASIVSGACNIAIGGISIYNSTPSYLSDFEEINFSKSCKVEIASSLTETDKLALLVNYDTR